MHYNHKLLKGRTVHDVWIWPQAAVTFLRRYFGHLVLRGIKRGTENIIYRRTSLFIEIHAAKLA
jgi:hypothetical protein